MKTIELPKIDFDQDKLTEGQIKQIHQATWAAIELLADSLHSEQEIDAWMQQSIRDCHAIGEQLKQRLKRVNQ